MRISALVPARGGSKGMPRKNRKLFCGRPLLQWAVEVGLESCDRVYVSTEDPGLAVLGQAAGAEVILRPEILAEDDTPMLEVVKHAVENIDADILVLLQPTQPLRRVEHVNQGLAVLERTGADSVVSVVEVPQHYAPDYVMRVDDRDCLEPFLQRPRTPTRRQDCRPAYSRDGTVYVMPRETIEGGSLYGDTCRPLIIPMSESSNLDTVEDWTRAEHLWGLRHG